jgi:hypothetical protein
VDNVLVFLAGKVGPGTNLSGTPANQALKRKNPDETRLYRALRSGIRTMLFFSGEQQQA